MLKTAVKLIRAITFIFLLLACALPARLLAVQSRAVEGVDAPDLNDYRIVAEARLDLVFQDGTVYLYSMYGEDRLTRRDTYRLLYMDSLGVSIQFSRVSGRMLVAHVTPPGAATNLPDGMMVKILEENLARPAVLKTSDAPEKISSRLRAVSPRARRTVGPFGIVTQVNLIPSDTHILFYFGQYSGLLEGDPVQISTALGKRVRAVVRKATVDGFVDCETLNADAHVFNAGEMVVIHDAFDPPSLNFAAWPNQRKIPGVPRFVEPSTPKIIKK